MTALSYANAVPTGRQRKTLTMLRLFEFGAAAGAGCGRQERPQAANFAGLLPAINHNGAGLTVSGTDASGWGSSAMRIYGSNGAALAAAPAARAPQPPAALSASASRRRRASAAAAAGAALDLDASMR